MKQLLEIMVFGGLAVGLHVGVWATAPSGSADGAGEGGTALMSLEASDPQLAALVEEWDQPPAVAEPVAALSPPLEQAPIVAPRGIGAETSAASRPPRTMPTPVVPEAAPQIETTPAAPPRPVVETADADTPRPVVRPDARAATPEPARSAARAAGTGAGQARGENQQASAATLSTGQRRALMANWGATIRARIERRKPRVSGRGTTTVRIIVGRDGQLQGVALAQSSGDGGLDRAAIRAVERAGRFPPAPRQLTDARYTFHLPVRFQ